MRPNIPNPPPLQVRYEGDPESALVQFSTPQEAKAAHSSTEAVLNNRFIRVYFLRKNQPSNPPSHVETSLVVHIYICRCIILCVFIKKYPVIKVGGSVHAYLALASYKVYGSYLQTRLEV